METIKEIAARRRAFIADRTQGHIDKIIADKTRRGLKNLKATASVKESAAAHANGEWVGAEFTRAKSDPTHWLNSDPVWNDQHPDYIAVNALIEKGATPQEAIARVAKGEEVLPLYPASEAQVNFIESLLAEKDHEGVLSIDTVAGTKVVRLKDQGLLDKKAASNAIGALKNKARKPAPKVETPAPVTEGLDVSTIPSGRYAVPNGDTRLKVHIQQGKAGSKWEGWTFVKDGAEYGRANRYGMQRPGERYAGDIKDELATILADPKAAMAAYGSLTGTCGNCARKLEDEESVRLGIGPICRRNLGW